MRLAFFILVFVNLAFYVWSAGFLGEHRDGREPERLTQQITPEKIRILRDLPAKEVKVAASTSKECQLISGLDAEEAHRLEQSLSAGEGVSVSLKTPVESTSHWVLIGNLPTREAVAKKQAELKALGIAESRLAQNEAVGPYVVSLGIFSNETLAQEFLASLNKKGVRSARIVPREKAARHVQLEVRAPENVINSLAGLIAETPGSSLGDCPAAATAAATP